MPFNRLAVHVVLSSFKFEAHFYSFFNVEGVSEGTDWKGHLIKYFHTMYLLINPVMLKIIARNTECHYCLFKIKAVVDRRSICLLQRNNFPEIRIHFICSLIKSLALLAPLAPRSHIACGAWSSSLNAFCTPLFQECLNFVWVGIWNSKSTLFETSQ